MTRFVTPLVLFVLASLSLVVLSSIAPSLVGRQLIFFSLAAGIFLITSRVSFQQWQGNSKYLYICMFGFLLLTQFIGRVTRGTTSWIPLGAFHIQPSQLVVAVTALFGSTFLAKKNTHWLPNLLALVLAPITLVMLEPDFGTASMALGAWVGTLLCLRIPKKVYLLSIPICLLVAGLVWSIALRPDQKQRISTFLNPLEDRQGAGYNAWQSLVAVGSGGVMGRGIGNGTQSHLRFLPEKQTDFIFASLAEEMGFVGSSAVISLYFLWWIAWIRLSAQAPLGSAAQWFALTSALWLGIQTFINIGMNLGIMPITGVTLPFLSYGGSSILTVAWHAGLMHSLARSLKPQAALHIR